MSNKSIFWDKGFNFANKYLKIKDLSLNKLKELFKKMKISYCNELNNSISKGVIYQKDVEDFYSGLLRAIDQEIFKKANKCNEKYYKNMITRIENYM